MKKLLVLFVALIFGLTSVSAMTESELKEKLFQSYTVNGVTFKATDQQKTLIETYLNDYELSSADCDKIYAKLEEVFNILKNSGKKSFYDLSRSQKDNIITIVRNLSAETSLDADIVDGELVVYVPNTNKADIFHKAPVNPIAQTNRNLIVAGLGIFSLLGMALAVKKIKNA